MERGMEEGVAPVGVEVGGQGHGRAGKGALRTTGWRRLVKSEDVRTLMRVVAVDAAEVAAGQVLRSSALWSLSAHMSQAKASAELTCSSAALVTCVWKLSEDGC